MKITINVADDCRQIATQTSAGTTTTKVTTSSVPGKDPGNKNI